MKWATVTLGALSLAIIGYSFTMYEPAEVQGRLLPDYMEERIPWVTLTANKVGSGTIAPPDTNIILHIPDSVERITRRVLFARKGETVRYWGYCFPADYERALALNRRGFPGELFLSEAEREARTQKLVQERRRTFSVFENLTTQDLNETQPSPKSYIRHQKEIFYGGETCYLMTESMLQVGTDADDDGLNAAMERGYGSDPRNPDTDGDGVIDGLEVYRSFTHPLQRDSDGDGLIDGIEDANQNGRFDPGETDPTKWDTDRDNLCDGFCKVDKGRVLRGEDLNLNGIVDENEFDPRKTDTNDDGIFDDHEVYLCELQLGKVEECSRQPSAE